MMEYQYCMQECKMELKELTSKTIELLNIENPEQIPDSLMEIVLNGKQNF